MKTKLLALGLTVFLAMPALAQAPETPAAPAPAHAVATTTIADLLDRPALRAVFEKHLPTIASHPQINEGRALTLPDIVQYVPDTVTPDKLAAIDAELKALPAQ